MLFLQDSGRIHWDCPFSESDIGRAEIDKAPPDIWAGGMYYGTKALDRFVTEEITNRGVWSRLDERARRSPLAALGYRTLAHLPSLVALDGPVHYQAISAIGRSVLELGIDSELIHRDGPEGIRTLQFQAFHQVALFRAARKTVEFYDKNPGLAGSQRIGEQREFLKTLDRTALEQAVRELWGITKKGTSRWPDHWSGKPADQRAMELGGEWEDRYRLYYPKLSWQVHSGSVGSAGLDAKHFFILGGETHDLVRSVALNTLRVMAATFELKIEGLEEKLQFLAAVPGFVICDSQLRRQGEPQRFFV